jgi:hypothetical protein
MERPNTMRKVSLTRRIKYLQDTDEQGDIGIMVLLARGQDYPTKVAEINSKSDFRFWFTQFQTQEVAGL